ncbi:MAG: HD domain-containing protein [Bacteroidaceae bacterium]|jgi:3'-5' exoribonuclease|nr:HD domain-containing protein [Bacteroidaceae bacterium]
MQTEFLVIGRSNATTRQGSPYAMLKVADAEQSFTISVWDVAPDMPPFQGQLVQFNQVKDFGGKKSCALMDMVIGLMADEKHPLYGLIPRPIAEQVWQKTITELLGYCTDETLKPIIQQFADKLYKPYSEYPAATTVHHAYPGGLVNHVHQMLHMLSGLYPCLPYQIKVERCILSILFHDYGKVYEYNRQGDTQADMYLLGHIYIGAHKLQNVLEQHNIDAEEIKRIIHCVLAHHGQREYGSPVLPCTQEAAIVTYLDNISAKVDAMEGCPDGEYLPSLGTHVQKG